MKGTLGLFGKKSRSSAKQRYFLTTPDMGAQIHDHSGQRGRKNSRCTAAELQSGCAIADKQDSICSPFFQSGTEAEAPWHQINPNPINTTLLFESADGRR